MYADYSTSAGRSSTSRATRPSSQHDATSHKTVATWAQIKRLRALGYTGPVQLLAHEADELIAKYAAGKGACKR